MKVIAGLCMLVALAVSAWRWRLDWPALGWWTAASASCIVGFAYIERFWDWFEEDLDRRGWPKSLAALSTPCMLVLAAGLPSRPSSALIGPLLTLPFLLVCEHWRRARLATAIEAERQEPGDGD